MDKMWDHRTGDRSLWCRTDGPVDASVLDDLVGTLTDRPGVSLQGDASREDLVATFDAGDAVAARFVHDPSTDRPAHESRSFAFDVVAYPGSTWFEVDDVIPGRNHLSWLSFVVLWTDVFDALEFAFATVQAERPSEDLPPELLREASELLVYGPDVAEQVGRGHLLATPALAVRELASGGVTVLVDRHPTEPVRRHLAGETVEDARDPVALPAEPPAADRPDDVVGMLAYLGDWVPRRITKFELHALDAVETADRLGSLVEDDRPRVREEAAWGIGVVAMEYTDDALESLDVERYRECLADLSPCDEALARRTTDDVAAVREAAAEALGWLPTAPGLEALETLLHDDRPAVRSTAAGQFGVAIELAPYVTLDETRQRKLDVLGEAFETDSSPEVRAAAAGSLGMSGGPAGIGYLAAGLEDPAPVVRKRARVQLAVRLSWPIDEETDEEIDELAAAIEEHAPVLARPYVDESEELEEIIEHQDSARMRQAIRALLDEVDSA